MSRHMFGGNSRAQGALSRFVNPPRTEPSPRAGAALPPNHPAVITGHTLFPSRVFDADQRGRVLIDGVNNAKIGKLVTKGPWAGFPIFTLSLEERATCPRSCAVWAECYGNALPVAVRFNTGPKLMAALDRELRAHAMANRGFVVRLHALGDFPDLEYVRRWIEWSDAIPELHVWGYTAHPVGSDVGAMLAAMNRRRPDRWSIRSSVAIDVPFAPMQAAVTWAKPNGDHSATDIACPAESGKTATCGTCALCWSPAAADKRIVFMGHGMRKFSGGRKSVTMDQPTRSVATADPITAGAQDFLARLLTEQTRLTRALETVGSLIGVYQKLVEGEAVQPPAPAPKAVAATPTRPAATAEGGKLFSPERNAIILRDYPLGVSVDEIRRRCLALPGRDIPRDRIAIKAHALGVHRPADVSYVRPPAAVQDAAPTPQPVVSAPPPAPPAPVAPKPAAPQPKSRMEALVMVSRAIDARPAFDPGEPVAVDFDQVRHWAGQRGLPFASWDDLPGVNRKREARGLPRFKRQFPVRGRVG